MLEKYNIHSSYANKYYLCNRLRKIVFSSNFGYSASHKALFCSLYCGMRLNKTCINDKSSQRMQKQAYIRRNRFCSVLFFLPLLHGERAEIFLQCQVTICFWCIVFVGLLGFFLNSHHLLQQLQLVKIAGNGFHCYTSKQIHVVGDRSLCQLHVYFFGDCAIVLTVQVYSCVT